MQCDGICERSFLRESILTLGRLLLGLAVVAMYQRVEAAEGSVDFAHDVVPILKQHCVSCHGGKESKGGFSINTRGLVLEAEVVDLEKSDASRLLELIRSENPDEQMPPKDRPRLSADEVATLERWIQQGLTWEVGFTFAEPTYEPPLLPRRPTLPPAIDGREHPVDRLVDAYLLRNQLTRPARLDDRQFLRRVSLDLVGLLPTPEQLQAFVDDAAPDKRARMIDRLLEDRENYATHWLSFWNDLLRNAYSGTGYIDGGRQQITQWLYQSLYQNLSYDEFVRQLISPPPQAAGFIQGIKWRGNVNASQTREIQFSQNLGQVFLGINMKCASCHDSFIDRWTLKETYDLAAVYSNEPLELHRCDKPQASQATPAWIFPELGQIDPLAPQPARLRQLAALMTHPQNGRLTRTLANRVWERLLGHGIVHPVDAMHTPPWDADLLDHLAVYLSDQSFDVKALLRYVTNSEIYQSQAVPMETAIEGDAFVFHGPTTKRLTAEQFLDAVRSITDNWPAVHPDMFQRDGRNQRGQLRDILLAMSAGASGPNEELANAPADECVRRWGDRHLRAALTDLDPLQAVLGRPIREQVVSSRPPDLTSLQAINLANGVEMAELLRQGAARCKTQWEQAAETERLVDRLYLYALSRDPTSDERSEAMQILGQSPQEQQIEDLLWIVMMLPEFQLVR